MDSENENGEEEEAPRPPRSEGVRIIGADEAAAALDSGQAAGRRPEDAPRYGDVPASPSPAAQPAARFPLPEAVDPSQVLRPPVAGAPRDHAAGEEPAAGEDAYEAGAEPAPWSEAELPHWTDPPTGEVPAVLATAGPAGEDEDDLAAWSNLGGGARWRDHPRDWDDAGFEEDAAALGGGDTVAGFPPEEIEEDHTYDEPLPEETPRRSLGGRRRLRTRAEAASRPGSGPAGRGPGGGPGAVPPPMAPPVSVQAPEPPGPALLDEPPAARRISSRNHLATEPGEAPPGAGRSGSGARILTGVAVGVVAVIALKAGPVPMLGLATLVATVAAAEAFGVFQRAGFRPATLLGLSATVAAMVGAYMKGPDALPLVATLTTMFAVIWYLAGVQRARVARNVGVTLLGFMWVGFLGSYAGLLLDPTAFPHRHGVAFLLAALVAAVSYDVGGWVVGSRIGRRPLAPAISPNKTWEGLLGGMAAALVVSSIVVGRIHPWTFHDAVALGLVGAVAAPVGDLCQSLIKRDLGIKDTGTILPGHGGFLDRIDAILFVLPATYYLVRVLGLG